MKRRDALQLLATAFLTTPVLAKPPRLVRLTGKLIVPDGAGTKKSYLTGNFQLITERERHILTGSRTVSEDDLEKFRGQWVSVDAIFLPSQSADPTEQAPIDPLTGQTVEHPASYQVRQISAYKGKRFKLFQ